MDYKKCKECGHENPISETICQECKFPLKDDSKDPSFADTGKFCPNCNKMFQDDINFCDVCGHDLSGADDDTVLAPLTPISQDTGSQTPDSSFSTTIPTKSWVLRVVEGMHVGKKFEIYKPEMLVGRQDDEEGIYPDIDLEGQDEGYVSRRHAYIRIKDDVVFVEDLGGINKTLVDNKPVEPRVETPVSVNQVIRIGKVGLMLQMEKGAQKQI